MILETGYQDLFMKISPAYSHLDIPDKVNQLANYNNGISAVKLNKKSAPRDLETMFNLCSPFPVVRCIQHRICSAQSVFKHFSRHVFGCLGPGSRLVLLFALV